MPPHAPLHGHLSFSQAIDRIGYGPYQARLLLLCGMAWVADAMLVLVISFVLDDIQEAFGVNAWAKGLVGSASFMGMLFGAMFFSVCADRRGRRVAFFVSLAVSFAAGLGSALARSYGLLVLLRALVGFGVGGNLPVAAALCVEFMPTADRATALSVTTGIYWVVGQVLVSLVGLVLCLEAGGGGGNSGGELWRWFLGVSALPAAAMVLAYPLLPESPRYLAVAGRHEEAARILEEVVRRNSARARKRGWRNILKPGGVGPGEEELGPGPGGQIESESERETARLQAETEMEMEAPSSYPNVRGGAQSAVAAPDHCAVHEHENGNGHSEELGVHHLNGRLAGLEGGFRGEEKHEAPAGNVLELFRTPLLRRITLCLWMVWFFENFSYYGIVFLVPEFHSTLVGEGQVGMYVNSVVLGASMIPGILLGLWLCTPERLGRLGTLKWMSHVAGGLVFLMAFTLSVPELFVPVSVLALMFLGSPGVMKYVVAPEIYATKHRTVGLGSASVCARAAGFLAPLVAEGMYAKGGAALPLLVFGSSMVLTGVFSALIPVETAGTRLDDASWDPQEESSAMSPRADNMTDPAGLDSGPGAERVVELGSSSHTEDLDGFGEPEAEWDQDRRGGRRWERVATSDAAGFDH